MTTEREGPGCGVNGSRWRRGGYACHQLVLVVSQSPALATTGPRQDGRDQSC